MAATRLSDSQKQELVARFRLGESAQALAEALGCSANTVSRVVRTALDPQEYESLKQQRGRPSSQVASGSGPSIGQPVGSDNPAEELPAIEGNDDEGLQALPGSGDHGPALQPGLAPELDSTQLELAPPLLEVMAGAEPEHLPEADSPEPGHAALAIDDADDFAEEAGDDGDDGDAGEDGDGTEEGDSFQGAYGGANDAYGQTFVVLPLGQAIEDRPSLTVQPLEPANLPASVYMLVDKTVELDIKPLKELPELGALPDGEGERQALVVYANPRQAKRYCGRNQRVIKVPDSGVLARTAPYLLSQGVTRLVVEGALYSLPGS